MRQLLPAVQDESLAGVQTFDRHVVRQPHASAGDAAFQDNVGVADPRANGEDWGLATGIGAELVLLGEITQRGVVIPTIPAVYAPVLKELARHGIAFESDVDSA